MSTDDTTMPDPRALGRRELLRNTRRAERQAVAAAVRVANTPVIFESALHDAMRRLCRRAAARFRYAASCRRRAKE